MTCLVYLQKALRLVYVRYYSSYVFAMYKVLLKCLGRKSLTLLLILKLLETINIKSYFLLKCICLIKIMLLLIRCLIRRKKFFHPTGDYRSYQQSYRSSHQHNQDLSEFPTCLQSKPKKLIQRSDDSICGSFGKSSGDGRWFESSRIDIDHCINSGSNWVEFLHKEILLIMVGRH